MSNKSDNKKRNGWSWMDFLPIILAFPLALLFKFFVFTTYHVPTASMVPTIVPGDHIIVEKWLFGPRFFIKNTLHRFPGWRSIERGDILVFNVPKEDSIFRQRREINFYNWKNSQAASPSSGIEKENFIFMPIPGRTPFVKRVIGRPGDELRYFKNALLVNGSSTPQFTNTIQQYEIFFRHKYDYDLYKDTLYQIGEHIQMNRADKMIKGIFSEEKLKFIPSGTARITPRIHFPHTDLIPQDFTWARALARGEDSLKIPFKGWKVVVDSVFLRNYGKIIKRFEGFNGDIRDQHLISSTGNILHEYTFRQNYYWALGDNRPYSIDSRSWGLIPQDHIIGVTRRTFWSKIPEQGFTDGFRWHRLWERLD